MDTKARRLFPVLMLPWRAERGRAGFASARRLLLICSECFRRIVTVPFGHDRLPLSVTAQRDDDTIAIIRDEHPESGASFPADAVEMPRRKVPGHLFHQLSAERGAGIDERHIVLPGAKGTVELHPRLVLAAFRLVGGPGRNHPLLQRPFFSDHRIGGHSASWLWEARLSLSARAP